MTTAAPFKLTMPGKEKLYIPAHAYTADRVHPGAHSILQDMRLRRQLGLLYGISGGSAPLQGYHTEGDIIRTTTDNVDTNVLWAEFTRLLTMYNARRQPIVDLLTYSVPRDVERVPQAGNNAEFERASEFGVPVGIRTGVTYFSMGFSFEDYDTGARFTWKFLRDADAEQVRAVNTSVVEADNRLIFGEVMRTLFRNDNRTAEIRDQAYTVYTFYNGNDSVVPPDYGVNTFDSTHNHYLVSGAATVTSGDLDDIVTHLSHHGYSRSNGYDIVILANENEIDVIRTFKSIQNGGTAKYDFIPALGTPNFLLPENFRINDASGGTRPPDRYRGIAVAGRYGDALILYNDYFPDKYLVGFATGGPENVNNPIGIREHERPEWRGLRLIKGRSPDYPLQESYWLRSFGTGIRHRGAGVVMFIDATGPYEPPAMYA